MNDDEKKIFILTLIAERERGLKRTHKYHTGLKAKREYFNRLQLCTCALCLYCTPLIFGFDIWLVGISVDPLFVCGRN